MGDGGFWQWVVAIEGIPYLLTDGDPDLVIAAWAGTGYTECLGGGLRVELVTSQEIHPHEGFSSGGKAKLIVMNGRPSAAGAYTNRFAKESARRASGAQTSLAQTINRTDASVNVLSTADFASITEVYIGTECLEVTVDDAQAFILDDRGLYAPFASGTVANRFAQHHRLCNFDYEIPIEPEMTEHARVWAGRRVGIWLHKRTDGELETKAEVETAKRRLFAGRWFKRTDDPTNRSTNVTLEHELDAIARTQVMREPLTAKVTEGFYLFAGDSINFRDNNASTTRTANALEVVASGATAPAQINEGYYRAGDLASALNDHLAAELAAARLHGTYTWAVRETADGPRFACGWKIDTATAGVAVWWEIRLDPSDLAKFLGIYATGSQIGGGAWEHEEHGLGDGEYFTDDAYIGTEPPRRIIFNRQNPGTFDFTIGLDEVKGTLIDQANSLPPEAAPQLPTMFPGLEWGIFLVDKAFCVVAALVEVDTEEFELQHVVPVDVAVDATMLSSTVFNGYGRVEGDGGAPIEIQQVVILTGPCWEVLAKLFYSTGTAGYNHATYDAYGFGIGLGEPHDILGDPFINSAKALPGADLPITIVIEKPTPFFELIESDLLIRRSHLLFEDGHIVFACWSTPTTEQAVHALTEANKAEPAEHDADHFARGEIDASLARPITKIKHNRSLRTGEYTETFVIIDGDAIDGAGGQGAGQTIEARNVYGEAQSQALLDLFAALVAWHPFFSREIPTAERSIDPTMRVGVSAGHIALVSDNDLEDPSTGERGLDQVPALITGHSYYYPVQMPGAEAADPGVGRIRFAMLPIDRIGSYSPCAEVDETAPTAGYVAATKVLTCKAHAHSAAADVADATRFLAGHKVRVVEIDPDDPASPLTWEDTVAGQTGNTITLTTGLAGWDTAKLYQVISDAYADATAVQNAKAYFADDADGKIQDEAPPFLYGDPFFVSSYVADVAELMERHANLARNDGAPRDTGYERGLVWTAETLLDHKTAPQSPMLEWNERTSGATGTDWELHSESEIFLQPQVIPNGMDRKWYGSTWFASTDGTATELRISICSKPLVDDSILNVARQGVLAEATFATSSTTRSIPTEVGLTLRAVEANNQDDDRKSGVAYLVVEYKAKCVTRGVAQGIVRGREV